MQVNDVEDKRAEELHRNLLLEKLDYLVHIPHDTRLVQYEAADEEKHRHPHQHENLVERAITRTEANAPDMHHHDQKHGESPQRVNILNPLGTYGCACILITNIIHLLQKTIKNSSIRGTIASTDQ